MKEPALLRSEDTRKEQNLSAPGDDSPHPHPDESPATIPDLHPEPATLRECAEPFIPGVAIDNGRPGVQVDTEIPEAIEIGLAPREGEERYRHVVQDLPAAIYTTDAEGRIKLFNQAAADLWGRAPKIGEDQWCGSYRIYRPDGTLLPHDQCPMAVTLKDGRIINGAEILVEREDGARRHVLAHPRPLRDTSGAIVGAINMLVDITDRKRAELELAETKNDLAAQVKALTRLHQLALLLAGPIELSAALDAIMGTLVELHDADCGILWLHDSASGYLSIAASRGFSDMAKQSLIGLSAQPRTSVSAAAFAERRRAIVEDLDADPRFDNFREARRVIGHRAVHRPPILTRSEAALGSISVYFKKPRRPKPREVQFADLCARYAAETIETAKTQEALRDSERKLRDQTHQLEQQLIASGRLVSLGEVTASMAHEFNNPLGIIIGFVEDMLANADPQHSEHRALEIIHEESGRCKKIVEDLMAYARPRNAEMSMTDVQSLIEKSFKLVEARLYKQKVEPMMKIAGALPKIYADPQQLTQVLVNLYLNAIDAMPGGGALTVSARTTEDQALVISVSDTGVGIEESAIDKIFQPFYTAKKKRGLGLGLPICERIVKNHGGDIRVQSRPGQGAIFEIYLPTDPAGKISAKERSA